MYVIIYSLKKNISSYKNEKYWIEKKTNKPDQLVTKVKNCTKEMAKT